MNKFDQLIELPFFSYLGGAHIPRDLFLSAIAFLLWLPLLLLFFSLSWRALSLSTGGLTSELCPFELWGFREDGLEGFDLGMESLDGLLSIVTLLGGLVIWLVPDDCSSELSFKSGNWE